LKQKIRKHRTLRGNYIQGERTAGQDENHQNKKTALIGNRQINYNNAVPAQDTEDNLGPSIAYNDTATEDKFEFFLYKC